MELKHFMRILKTLLFHVSLSNRTNMELKHYKGFFDELEELFVALSNRTNMELKPSNGKHINRILS